MGRITSNVGLITGIPITDTVDQLIAVAGTPRDLLVSRTEGLQSQQLAINSLATRLLSLQFDLGKLNVSDPYGQRTVTSQNEDFLTATLVSGTQPAVGDYRLRPVQMATSQQFISQRFENLDDIQETGTLTFGYGGFVDKGISLDELNNGLGVARGEIKITDSNGASAIIDLSLARSVDEVLDAINNESTIDVTASVSGDRFTLLDTAGGGGTLDVQEVSGGSTAADLGLLDPTPVGSLLTGDDVFALHSGTKLARLNDGNGVRITDDTTDIDDLLITLADGTSAGVDLSGTTTLGEVVDAINNDADFTGKLTATISAVDGNRLVLTDSTSGASTFAVTNGVTGSAAEDLGLTETASGGTITGRRLVSGLGDTLLSSLNGGQGLGTVGEISITDRAGNPAVVIDLASAETLADVVDLINNSTANVTASINTARNGLLITDTSGGTGNLVIANSGATTTADALALTVNAAQASVNSGTLGRQTLSEATLLSSLNGGLGITPSDIEITDSSGQKTAIDLNSSGSEAKTVGDVIDAINAATSIDVTARINDTGDGILITDTALGTQTLGLKDVNGTLAADLNLTRASETININGQDTQVVDGTSSYSVDLANIGDGATSITLASLNDGNGIDFSGDIKITDSQGRVLGFDLNGTHSGITTVGQLIDAINADAATQNVAVTASINAAGTGILLTDKAGGSGNLIVEDLGGTAAADLNLLSTETTTTTIDGFGLFPAQSTSQGALETLADRINDLDSGVVASVLNDGIGFRLQLVVDQTGSANEILLDAAGTGFVFDEISSAQDALLVLGEGQSAGSGVLVSSPTNDFSQVVSGVELTVVAPSSTPIDITVATTDEQLVSLVEDFVESYNAVRSELDTLTDFNETDLTTGLLFGTNEALRVDVELSRVLTDRFLGVGSFQSLEEIGLSLDDEGKLQLDKAELQEAFASDAKSLQTLFTDSDNGVVAKFNETIERLAGADNGLLTNRNDSLQATIDINQQRIDRFNESLERQRETLLLQFYQLEQVIAGLQANQSALAALQPLAPLVSTASK